MNLLIYGPICIPFIAEWNAFYFQEKSIKHKLVDWKITNKRTFHRSLLAAANCWIYERWHLKYFLLEHFYLPHCWVFLCMNKLSWVISRPPGLSQDNERLLAIFRLRWNKTKTGSKSVLTSDYFYKINIIRVTLNYARWKLGGIILLKESQIKIHTLVHNQEWL